LNSLGQGAYDLLWQTTGPFVARSLRRRLGPVDTGRWSERLGRPSIPRPGGALIWLHASSVGEAVSLHALVCSLREAGFEGTLLATSFTVSGGQALAKLPDVLHQYIPLDHPAWRAQFFEHWRPNLAVMMVAEVWPGLLLEARKRGVPLVLASAAPSDRSLGRWGLVERLGLRPFRQFDHVFAVDRDRARALSSLVRVRPEIHGDLKVSAPRPSVDSTLVEGLRAAADGRRVLLAASTHPGEDEPLLELVASRPNIFCIIAPRHPGRADSIVELAAARGLMLAQRTRRLPKPDDTIFLLDTLGEMGSAYAASDVTFVGGSLRGAGHSPAEAALFGCAAVIGPGSSANQAVTRELLEADALVQGSDVVETMAMLAHLLDDTAQCASMSSAARGVTRRWKAPARRSAAGLLAQLSHPGGPDQEPAVRDASVV